MSSWARRGGEGSGVGGIPWALADGVFAGPTEEWSAEARSTSADGDEASQAKAAQATATTMSAWRNITSRYN